MGLGFEGREHSGVEDARNTARLVWRMVQDGCLLQETGSVPTEREQRELGHRWGWQGVPHLGKFELHLFRWSWVLEGAVQVRLGGQGPVGEQGPNYSNR